MLAASLDDVAEDGAKIVNKACRYGSQSKRVLSMLESPWLDIADYSLSPYIGIGYSEGQKLLGRTPP